jgi:hypothetical protein
MSIKKALTATVLIGTVFTIGLIVGQNSQTAYSAPAENARVYELRTYHTNDGKLDDLHARFSNHTNHLFVKHGMSLIGYWTPIDGDGETLTYMIGHESQAAAKDNWKGFVSDPDWTKAYADSRKNGPLVKNIESTYLQPTDYSPLR